MGKPFQLSHLFYFVARLRSNEMKQVKINFLSRNPIIAQLLSLIPKEIFIIIEAPKVFPYSESQGLKA
jgi:hypothetical protein